MQALQLNLKALWKRYWWLVILAVYVGMKIWSWYFAMFMDFPLFLTWSQHAVDAPLNQFYGGDWVARPGDWDHRALNSDRFPTDVYIFALWGLILKWLPDVNTTGLLMTVLQGTVWLLELLVAAAIWSLFKKLGVPKPHLWAVGFLMTPFFFYIANQQFTLEFVPLLFTLLAFRLLLEKKWYLDVAAGIFFVIAALERPQFGLLMLGVLIIVWLRGFAWWRPVALFLPALPFAAWWSTTVGLGLWWQGTKGSLIDMIRFNAEFYDHFTVSAATAWAWWPRAASTDFPEVTVLGIPVTFISFGLIGLFSILAVIFAVKSDRSVEYRIWWALAAVNHMIFFFGLRMIDRYNFVAIFILFLMLALYPKVKELRPLFLVVMLTSFLNGLVVYTFWDFMYIYGEHVWLSINDVLYKVLAFGNLVAIWFFYKAIKPGAFSELEIPK